MLETLVTPLAMLFITSLAKCGLSLGLNTLAKDCVIVFNPLEAAVPTLVNSFSVFFSETHLEIAPKIGFLAFIKGFSSAPNNAAPRADITRSIPGRVFIMFSEASAYFFPNEFITFSASLALILPAVMSFRN